MEGISDRVMGRGSEKGTLGDFNPGEEKHLRRQCPPGKEHEEEKRKRI